MQQLCYLAGKSPRVISLKKIVNSIHTSLLLCDVVLILLHKLLSFIHWYCHIEFVDIVILSCHYYQCKNLTPPIPHMKKKQKKPRLYSLDASTNLQLKNFRLSISLCILNDDCMPWKSMNFYQVHQAHIKKFWNKVI